MWVRVDLQTLKKMSHSFWYSGIQEIYDSVSCVVKFIHNHKFITLCKTNIVIILMFTWTEGNGNGIENNSDVKRSRLEFMKLTYMHKII